MFLLQICITAGMRSLMINIWHLSILHFHVFYSLWIQHIKTLRLSSLVEQERGAFIFLIGFMYNSSTHISNLQFWCSVCWEILTFGAVSCRSVCLLFSMMKSDGTSVMVLKVTKNAFKYSTAMSFSRNHLLVTQGNQRWRWFKQFHFLFIFQTEGNMYLLACLMRSKLGGEHYTINPCFF